MSETWTPRPERFLSLATDGRPHLFDGGFGTELHYRGVSVTRCFDELNLSRPEEVTKVHELFLQAGAEILETNTYGASRTKLAPFGSQVAGDSLDVRIRDTVPGTVAGPVTVLEKEESR